MKESLLIIVVILVLGIGYAIVARLSSLLGKSRQKKSEDLIISTLDEIINTPESEETEEEDSDGEDIK